MRRILAVGVLAFLGFLPGEDAKKFTDWSTPVNLGPVINTSKTDACTTVSKNGLKLFFRSTVSGSQRFYVSYRTSLDSDWGMPQLAWISTDYYSPKWRAG